MFPVSCRFSSFTISVHTEIFIPSLICFIICIKACNGTVSNLLIFRIPLLRNNSTTENSTKNDNNYNNKNRSSDFALKMYRNYLPKMIPISPTFMYKGKGNCFENISDSWTGFIFVPRMLVHISFGQTIEALWHFSKVIVIVHLRHDHDQTKTIFL